MDDGEGGRTRSEAMRLLLDEINPTNHVERMLASIADHRLRGNPARWTPPFRHLPLLHHPQLVNWFFGRCVDSLLWGESHLLQQHRQPPHLIRVKQVAERRTLQYLRVSALQHTVSELRGERG